MSGLLRALTLDELRAAPNDAVDPEALSIARAILEEIAKDGEAAARRIGERLGDLLPDGRLVYRREEMKAVFDGLNPERQALLRRVAERIRQFAECQRHSIKETSLPLPGGVARQIIAPVKTAGCYAPGGNYPLPSSALMTAVTARAAGVETVIVASPKPAPITIAAAYVAGADALLSLGGAQAIGALVHGVARLPGADTVVGPGNRFVTAAKSLVSDRVGIDMLAGPSELIVVADDTADASIVAADLIAQAEHSCDARPFLISLCPKLPALVNHELAAQLAVLPTSEIATAAMANGGYVIVQNEEEAILATDLLAPEHLEVMTRDATALSARFAHYGGIFIGMGAAEVLGDYGAGPNHTLPTGAGARHSGGLSVFNFLRIRTALEIHDLHAAQGIVEDTIALAREEGLEGHARSAMKRQRAH